MGVEYKHFIIPAVPTFLPSNDVLVKVDAVLQKWNLRAANPTLYDLTTGESSVVDASMRSIPFGHGIAVEYSGTEGVAVRNIMGESYYPEDVSDEERYIERITYIVGMDYRIHPSNEEMSIEAIFPPYEDETALEPYCECDTFLHSSQFAEAYHCSASATPPKVTVSVSNHERIIGEQNFSGYWRTAFIIDCGKDLPAVGEEFYKVPNRAFIQDIETALGCKVVEIGEVY